MTPPQLAQDVVASGAIVPRPCVYRGIILIGGAAAASSCDVRDGLTSSGMLRDRIDTGIAETQRVVLPEGVPMTEGIWLTVDGNQAKVTLLYDELQGARTQLQPAGYSRPATSPYSG